MYSKMAQCPIAFASWSLTPSEHNYAHLEKEALSLIFAVKKFHRYLYGRKFTLITDHKPLTTILGPKKGIPSLAVARLKRWAMVLSAYNYDIQYKNIADHSNADGLSRLPLSSILSPTEAEGATTFNIGQIQVLSVSFKDIQKATRHDKIHDKASQFVRNGW
jgi:hypothetical protein